MGRKRMRKRKMMLKERTRGKLMEMMRRKKTSKKENDNLSNLLA